MRKKREIIDKQRKKERAREKKSIAVTCVCYFQQIDLFTQISNFDFQNCSFLFGVLARGCILMIWATNKSKPIQVYDDFVYMNFASYKFVCSVSFLLAFSSHETNEFECITFSFIHYMFTWLSLSSPVLSRYVIVSRNVLIELDQLCILICIYQLDQNMC